MSLVFRHEALHRLAADIFEAAGAPGGEAEIVAEHLVSASLLGYDTHGVMRIPQYVDEIRQGAIRPGAPIVVSQETETTAVVDCGWTFGQVGGLKAIDTAIEKARRWKTATVVARCCNHAGRLGAYTTRAAEQGLLAIGVCNSPRHGHFVTPWGGREGRLATNPISFAVPGNSAYPMVADFSTAEASEGAIRLLRNQGQPLPDGWILDAEGNPSNDAADFYGPPRGTILPLGGQRGYRGFALSLLVEVLGGLLGGSPVSKHQPGNGLGFVVIDVSAFIDPAGFAAMVEELVGYVKATPAAPGFEEVFLPGEADLRRREQRMKEGIPVDEATWRQIEATAASLGASVPSGGPR